MMTILVDCHFLGYRAFYTTGQLSHEEKASGIPFGFLWSILLMAEKFKTNKFLFLWDSPSFRRKIFPEYKISRRECDPKIQEQKKQIYEQFNYIRDSILPRMNFHSWQVPGMEADDLIASTIVNHSKERFIIASADNDLYQLLQYKNVAGMYDPIKHKIFRAFDFYQKYGIPPREWLMVKCLAGCPGDGVPGIPGVGNKTAIKYITGRLKETSKAYKEIKNSKKIIKRNLQLVKLPVYTTPIIPLPEIKITNLEVIKELFFRLGFESFLEERTFSRWGSFFAGDF